MAVCRAVAGVRNRTCVISLVQASGVATSLVHVRIRAPDLRARGVTEGLGTTCDMTPPSPPQAPHPPSTRPYNTTAKGGGVSWSHDPGSGLGARGSGELQRGRVGRACPASVWSSANRSGGPTPTSDSKPRGRRPLDPTRPLTWCPICPRSALTAGLCPVESCFVLFRRATRLPQAATMGDSSHPPTTTASK